MNPNYNDSQFPGASLIKRFFSRTSVLTVTVASAIFSVLVILQTIISTASGNKINMLASLYYLFDNNIQIVNAVFGVIVCIVAILFFMSFLSVYLKSKNTDPEPPTSGISLLTLSSIIYIIVTCITVTLAFASISVLRYESYKSNINYDRREFESAPQLYTSVQANYDFFIYILFGAAAIMLGIGAVRVTLAMKKACLGEEIPSNRGGALFLTGAIASLSMTTIAFLTSLSNLVVPNVSSSLKTTDLLISIIDVLIFASVTVVFFALAFLSSGYSTIINKTYHQTAKPNSYYAGYATNVYPTNAVRPPMPNVTPYNQTRHQYNPPISQQPPVYAPPVQQQPAQQPAQQPVQQPIPQSEPVQNTVQSENIQKPSEEEVVQSESVTTDIYKNE